MHTTNAAATSCSPPGQAAERRNEKPKWCVWRIRWMPRSAAAMTSSRVAAAKLASSSPLRLAHSGSTGFSSGA